ncbi:MAG: division/cell wall cluster transcriptional repressor MraZ [Desulfobacterales bacterium]|nr:division/cell wall cluster transcriptional repressor MraZ [Desulfobacterales bacterium]
MMFRGTSFHTIDPKGRFVIPSRFRDMIRTDGIDRIMISRLDRGLSAYTFEEWKKIETKVISMAEKSGNIRRFRRVFIGGAFECSCDKQGRVLIPRALRLYAEIEKEVVLVGVLDHFEIWSRENWEKENMSMEKDMKEEDVRNEIARIGL